MLHSGTNKNLFGAFDELMVLSYKWEHHGYEMRANFQSSVLSNFMALVNYSTFCLNEHYLAIKDDPEKKTELAEWLGFWKGLFGTATLPETALTLLAEDDDADGAATGVANEVAAMATAQKLVKRADNIRYYQVPRHQVQIAAQRRERAHDQGRRPDAKAAHERFRRSLRSHARSAGQHVP